MPPGLPLLPQAPVWHPLQAPLTSLDVRVLDVVDVVVSKLKRFSANDRSDSHDMIAAEHVSHARFVERFRAVLDARFGDEALAQYVENFHEIERDDFFATTAFDLPSWLD